MSLDSGQDGDGAATDDVTNQEAVYSQIKKFQVCVHVMESLTKPQRQHEHHYIS